MSCKFTDLQSKEVICLSNGQRLGFVSDVLVELPEGKVCALVVPGRCRFFGLFGRMEDFVIPWRSICRVGGDIILVDCKPSECRVPRKNSFWLG